MVFPSKVACKITLLLGAFPMVALGLGFCAPGDEPKPGFPNAGPLSPREEQATFRLPKGFKIELAACEPEVVDPVALAFDEDGRLYVAEMHGYPNAGVGTGKISSGKIKLLEDRDGDGFFEKSTVFADNLRFPTSVMPWGGGLLVCNAPDLVFFKDTDGDRKADQSRILYTGFDLGNIQQLVNSLQWGLDNWVHGCAGGKGGTLRSPEKPEGPEVVLRGRGIRFHPDRPGSLEPTSGGGQFGLAADLWGRWFTNTNSQHLRNIILPDHYLRRNPNLPVTQVTLDIPDHGPACKVHRISPFEAWRVERTRRRKEGADSKRFPANELVPGGFITSGCSPLIYLGDLFPEVYRGNSFICDPANNLIHRDILVPKGATFTAQRADADCEFLASTDNWFRPVHLVLGPDGAIYLADFYREVIETPLSLPEDIKKNVNLQSRKRGRIWRIRTEENYTYRRPALSKASTPVVAQNLGDGNSWWRFTAQRLLVERQDQSVIPALENLAREGKLASGRAHALWTLQGLKVLKPEIVEAGLKDPEPGVRIQALKVSEDILLDLAKKSEVEPAFQKMCRAIAALAEDHSPQVRFQLAFTMGTVRAPEFYPALAKVLRRDAADPWTQVAVLTSIPTADDAAGLLCGLIQDPDFTKNPGASHLLLVSRLSAQVAHKGSEKSMSAVLNLFNHQSKETPRWELSIIEGLGQGLPNRSLSLEKLLEKADGPARARMLALFSQAGAKARDEKRPLEDRAQSIKLLGVAPFAMSEKTLAGLLSAQQPQQLQLAAVRALGQYGHEKVAPLLLASWNGYSPTIRREVLEALFARPERVPQLLDAIAAKKVLAGQLEPTRLDQLRKYADPEIRKRAIQLLAGQVAPDRQKVVEAYMTALDLKADASRGKILFKKICAACHRLENEGVEVGADLQSILINKTPERLLIDILDPSREVDPRFIEYLVTTTSGKAATGLIAAETASSVTLRRAEKVEDTILRSQIESIRATAKSLMPDGLEMQLARQDLADLIAYLQKVGQGN